MTNMINSLFQQKEQEGFFGKEMAKEVARYFARKYKNDFAKGDNPIVALSLCCLIELIWQTAYSREIDITREEIASEVMKEREENPVVRLSSILNWIILVSILSALSFR